MDTIGTYENFPPKDVAAAVLVNLFIYALGAFILSGFGAVMIAAYLLFCLGNEVHVMKKSCVDCFYYGKWCAFGKGKVAAFLFKQGDPKSFAGKSMSHKDLVPDLLVVMFPLIGGIALLLKDFSLALAASLGVFLAVSFYGTYLIRSRVACAGCRQRELGCPAEQFFSKKVS